MAICMPVNEPSHLKLGTHLLIWVWNRSSKLYTESLTLWSTMCWEMQVPISDDDHVQRGNLSTCLWFMFASIKSGQLLPLSLGLVAPALGAKFEWTWGPDPGVGYAQVNLRTARVPDPAKQACMHGVRQNPHRNALPGICMPYRIAEKAAPSLSRASA
jgi:hypothetical protein